MKIKLLLVAAILVVILAINLLALEGSGVVPMFENGFKSLVDAIMPSGLSTDVTGQESAPTEAVQTMETGTQDTLSPELMEVQKQNERRLVDGCMAGKDCIQSIDEPKFITAGKAKFLNGDDPVLGIFYGGEARAYPVKILNYHGIVNDTIGGMPVVVTYCPLSGAAVAFEGLFGGSAVNFESIASGKDARFGVSGKLLNDNLVIYDRGTESFWSQMTGEALTGPQTGNQLQNMPVQVMSYNGWLAKYPKTKILSTDTGFERDYEQYPYGDYRESPVVYYPLERSDGRLPPKIPVFGVSAGGKAKAYPLTELMKALPEGGEFEDKIGDIKFTVSYKDRFFSTADVATRAGSQVVPDAGTQATADGVEKEPLPFRSAYWFAWAAFYPSTEVFTAK